MTCEPLFLGPLRANVTSWGLPPEVAAALLEEVGRQIENVDLSEHTRVHAFEATIPDQAANSQYSFYVWFAVRIHDQHVLITDCDCQVLWPST